MHVRLTGVVVGSALLLTLVACPASPIGGVLNVTIIGGDRDLGEGAVATLTADVQTTGDASATVSWASSDVLAASIDADGDLTAHAAGVTTITATSVVDPTKSDSVAVTAHPSGAILSVTIEGGDRTLGLGFTTTLIADVQATGDASTTVRWTSSDTDVGLVDAEGTLATLAAGATIVTATSVADPAKSDSIIVTVEPPGTHRWTRQIGTSDLDVARAIATDASGHVYASGYTAGALEGTSAGGNDAFVRSFDSEGDVRWTRQFGTAAFDVAYGIAADANDHVYAAGHTRGRLDDANTANHDAFVRSYDADGDPRWYRGFGTPGLDDVARGVASDAAGNVYAAGDTYGALEGANAGETDAFVRSFGSDGDARWTRQFGTADHDVADAIATDADGNVYVTGSSGGELAGPNAGGFDAFISSYDGDGDARWTRQFGTAGTDYAFGVATDPDGNVVMAGSMDGDAYLRSYDADGDLRWARRFGASGYDIAYGIATDAHGNVYAAGYSAGALEGANAGSLDAFVRSYDADGNLRWTRQFGTASSDVAYGLAAAPNGDTYLAGRTSGALDGRNAGGIDAFVRSYGR